MMKYKRTLFVIGLIQTLSAIFFIVEDKVLEDGSLFLLVAGVIVIIVSLLVSEEKLAKMLRAIQ